MRSLLLRKRSRIPPPSSVSEAGSSQGVTLTVDPDRLLVWNDRQPQGRHDDPPQPHDGCAVLWSADSTVHPRQGLDRGISSVVPHVWRTVRHDHELVRWVLGGGDAGE